MLLWNLYDIKTTFVKTGPNALLVPFLFLHGTQLCSRFQNEKFGIQQSLALLTGKHV